MGLDVYLYRYEDFAACTANESAAEKFSEATWERVGAGAKYDALTERQKDEAREATKAYYAEHGLDEWGDDKTNKQKIEINSAKYPEHMFKIGYFRSSYNAGGFERVVGDLIGMGLHDVFNPDDDEYRIRPDWTLAREIASELIRKLRAAPKLRVMTVEAVPLFGAQSRRSSADAITLTQTERDRNHPFGDGWYSNATGHFTQSKPLSIVSAIAGVDVCGLPCVHLVYEDTSDDWYGQAAEIVLETIDYVLAQPDREKYVLHWSG